jgi:hypothetical protein
MHVDLQKVIRLGKKLLCVVGAINMNVRAPWLPAISKSNKRTLTFSIGMKQ